MPKAVRSIPDLRPDAPDLPAWQRLVARHHQPSRRRFRNDQQIDDDFAVLIAMSEAAWAARASDIRLLGSIAKFWLFPPEDRDEYRRLTSAKGPSEMDSKSVARLIRASIAAS